jgi:hypothetical protein
MSVALRFAFVLAALSLCLVTTGVLENVAAMSPVADDPEEVRLRAETNEAEAAWGEAVNSGDCTEEEVARRRLRWKEALKRWNHEVGGRYHVTPDQGDAP